MENKEKETKNEIKEENKLFVEREKFKGSDGKDYWSYVLKGKVRNRDIKVDFAPKDKGGYEPLDIVFEVAPKAELLISDEIMTDNAGNKTKYKAYCVRTVENGVPYECNVKPARDSDKALLGMLINQLNADKAK